MPADLRTVIINADDFGLTAGVNAGIAEAHRAGTVSAASLLVNMPGFADAVQRAAALPTLDLGLHVNLTLGAPVSPPERIPSLIDPATGHFWGLWALARRAFTGQLRAEEVHREVFAQWQVAVQAGVPLSHLDGHQHAHLLPDVAPVVWWFAESMRLRHVRVPLEPSRIRPSYWRATAVKGALRLAWSASPGLTRSPVRHWRGLSLEGHPDFAREFLAELRTLPRGVTEIMVHPGYVDAELAALDPYLAPRSVELTALLSEPVREALRAPGFRLVSFRDC